jgi:cytoskeletal protein CcmA (bactofilin family)
MFYLFTTQLRRTLRARRIAAVVSAVILTAGPLFPQVATAQSTWNPTLLVNTESFQIIDGGDGTTNIELKFGTAIDARLIFDLTNGGRFRLTKGLFIQGSLTATGSVYVLQNITATGSITAKGTLSGTNLVISNVSSFSGASTFRTNATVKGTLSGQTLRVSGNADVQGALTASGGVRTDGNIVINDDADSNNAVLTFGNTSGNQTITFVNSSQTIQFSKGISVIGTISGSSLRIDNNANVQGTLSAQNVVATGSITAKGTLSGKNLVISGGASISGATLFRTTVTTKGTLSGQTLRVTGNADVNGALSVTGALRTDSNITINDDADSNNAVLTFGNTAGNQTFTFLNASQGFQFSKGISVLGTISGSSLRVDGNANVFGTLTARNIVATGSITANGTLSGKSLVISGASSFSGAALFRTNVTTKGAFSGASLFGAGLGDCNNSTTSKLIYNPATGKFGCAADQTGAGSSSSGEILSLHPEYPNHVYYHSGSSYIGQLTASGGNIGQYENFYHWTSTKAGIQDYWISVRVRIPDNFSSWDPVKSLQLRYRTGVGGPASTTTNHITVRVIDSAGVTLDGTGSLTNNSFTTANIPLSTGTWTPKTNITVLIKMATTSSGFAEVGFLNFNWENNIP